LLDHSTSEIGIDQSAFRMADRIAKSEVADTDLPGKACEST
jgi:hypothetical protein